LGRFCIPNLNLYSSSSISNCSANSNTTSNTTSNNTSNNTNCTDSSLIKQQTSLLDYFTSQYVNSEKLFAWLGDLVTTKNILFASIGFAFVITIIYLCLIRLIGRLLVYTTILLVQAGFIILGWLFQKRIDYYENVVKDDTYRTAMLVLCIFFYVLAAVWFIYIMFMCNAIRLALALLQVNFL
jgi:hypothetical protein